MKTVFIVGMPNGFFSRCKPVLDTISSTFSELGVELVHINLMESYLPYYEDGVVSEGFNKIAAALKESKNIVFAFNVTDNSPGAVTKVFLEYFGDKQNASLLLNKNVFIISISNSVGEREACGYVSKIMERHGGFETLRMCISGASLNDILSGAFPMDSVEKYAEDFYRLIKQNRRFLRSGDYCAEAEAPSAQKDYGILRSKVESSFKNTMQNAIVDPFGKPQQTAASVMSQEPASADIPFLQPSAPTQSVPQQDNPFGQEFFSEFVSEMPVRKPHVPEQEPPAPPAQSSGGNYDIFNRRQEEDIEELTKLFSHKLKPEDSPAQNQMLNPTYENPSKSRMPAKPAGADNTMPQAPPPQQMPQAAPPRHDYQPQGYFDEGADRLFDRGLDRSERRDTSYGYAPSPQQEPVPMQTPPNMRQSFENQTPYQQGIPAQPPSQDYGMGPAYDQKYMNTQPPSQAAMQPPVPQPQVTPRDKTVRQMTQNLHHYFQSHLAQDTEAVFQFNIFGEEEFNGYLVIKNKDNEYFDGQYESPDITIIASSGVWKDILRGKFTAQKAFMTGQLKVRGNFMLLNRFDQLYKKMS